MNLYSPQFGTTATSSNLTTTELDSLGFRSTKVVGIEILSQNGKPLTDIFSNDLLTHFWTVLGQNPENLMHLRSTQTHQQTLRVYYRVKELVHLAHISHEANFDFFELLPEHFTADVDIKPIVYQCLLLGSADAC